MPYYRCPGCHLTVHSAAAYSGTRVCPNCSAKLPDAAKRYPTAATERRIERVLAAHPEAPAKARRTLVPLPLPEPVRQTLVLIASELVTNAFLHAGLAPGDPIELRIEVQTDRVRLTVHDNGPGFTPPKRAVEADERSVGGRGLVIVTTLADAWGVDCDGGGCTVWCEVEIEEAPAVARDRRAEGRYVRSLAVEMTNAGPRR